jgi:hypothetical protein
MNLPSLLDLSYCRRSKGMDGYVEYDPNGKYTEYHTILRPIMVALQSEHINSLSDTPCGCSVCRYLRGEREKDPDFDDEEGELR